MTASPRKPPPPSPSATVVLVRQGDERPEVLLVRRHARTSFGASYVFPGGLLEPGDRDAHRHCASSDASRAAACLRSTDDALDYYSAAIRELFEETGVLLARGPDGDRPCDASRAAERDGDRRRLNEGSVTWAGLLERRALLLACDRLHYFAHWITPVALAKRFTTRFFLAELPPGQCARHDDVELTDSRWMTAAAALDAAGAGELELPPPTRATLEELAAFDDVAAVIDWAKRKEAGGVEAWLPAIVGAKGEERVVMPGDADYPRAGGAGEAE